MINKYLTGGPINLQLLYANNKLSDNRFIDTLLLRNVDNYMLDKNVGFPQRQAIAYTILQEGSTLRPHGNGAAGLFGWRGNRAKNLPSTVEGLSKKAYDELFGKFNADNWNHGGKGSGYMTGKDAQNAFINATNVIDATKALNFGYVRPPYIDRVNRTNNVSRMYQKKANRSK